ncbi:hypothetical protein AB1A81_06625 [Bdellovibrio bacteriovorus]|nr:hypothetical protein [Bdellovibrio bacteriovorus]
MLNIVELLKDLAGYCVASQGIDAVISAKRDVIELYMVFKWLTLIMMWVFGLNGFWSSAVVAYLIAQNVFTYFDHHVWSVRGNLDEDRIKMRFVMVLQAVVFNVVCFSYLFANQFNGDFNWGSFSSSNPLIPLSFSFMNTLSGGSSVATPTTAAGVVLLGLQVFTTFVFLTVILTKATTKEGV